MQRSTLTALLVSTVIGASLVGYGVLSRAEDSKAKTETAAKPAAGKDDYTVIKYKGGEISKKELDTMWANMFPGADAPKYDTFDDNVKLEILKNIVRERLVLDRAYEKNIDHTDAVKTQLENAKRQIVVQEYLKSIMDEIVPEKDVRKEYNVLKEKFAGKEEVRASHILVESEEEAKEIGKQLKDGGDFAQIAKEKSIDKASGENGGDLGYFTKERMVPTFAEAAFKAKKGEITAPVKSDFGWHIIKVVDKRPVQPPKYEDVKDRIQQTMANDAIERYLNKLVNESNVKYFGEGGEELKASAAAQ